MKLLNKIEKVEPSPFLLTNIYGRLEQLEESTVKRGSLITVGFGLILLLTINFYALSTEEENNNISESVSSIYSSNQLYND